MINETDDLQTQIQVKFILFFSCVYFIEALILCKPKCLLWVMCLLTQRLTNFHAKKKLLIQYFISSPAIEYAEFIHSFWINLLSLCPTSKLMSAYILQYKLFVFLYKIWLIYPSVQSSTSTKMIQQICIPKVLCRGFYD